MSSFQAAARWGVGRLVRLPLKLLPKRSIVPILRGPLAGRRWIVGTVHFVERPNPSIGTIGYQIQRLGADEYLATCAS